MDKQLQNNNLKINSSLGHWERAAIVLSKSSQTNRSSGMEAS